MKTDPFRSNMNNYASAGVNSGLSRKDPTAFTGAKPGINMYQTPHQSNLQMIQGLGG